MCEIFFTGPCKYGRQMNFDNRRSLELTCAETQSHAITGGEYGRLMSRLRSREKVIALDTRAP